MTNHGHEKIQIGREKVGYYGQQSEGSEGMVYFVLQFVYETVHSVAFERVSFGPRRCLLHDIFCNVCLERDKVTSAHRFQVDSLDPCSAIRREILEPRWMNLFQYVYALSNFEDLANVVSRVHYVGARAETWTWIAPEPELQIVRHNVFDRLGRLYLLRPSS